MLGIVLASGEGTQASTIQTITNSMVSSFTSMTSDMMSGVGSILPVVLPIVGAIAVIFLGVRLFNRLSKG